MQDLPNGGGGGRTPSPEGASRVGLCGRGGGANSWGGGGGGADASIGPRALETLGTPLGQIASDTGVDSHVGWLVVPNFICEAHVMLG